MKKKILAILFVFCTLIIAGCGKNSNIKLSSTNLSASDFYCNAFQEYGFILSSGANALYQGESETFQKYMGLMSSVVIEQNLICSIVSAMDFCIAVNESETTVAENQKIYEYSLSGDDSVTIVIVNKTKNKSIYNCSLYENVESTLDIGSLMLSKPTKENTFNITLNSELAQYEYTDSANKVNGWLYYNKNQGKMQIVTNKTESTPTGDVKYTINTNLYNYRNDVVGGRITTSILANNKPTKTVQEFLAKDFYKVAKFGVVKDASLYVNMEKTEESLIGVDNKGDSYGYKIAYNGLGDVENTGVGSYGKFE